MTCLNSDNGDTSLGNFSGTGSFGEGTAGPVSGGTDTGYDSAGNQSSHGGHVTVSFGGGLGGSVQGSLTSIVCLFGCPPPPVTVCGDLGCDSSPGKSASDPAAGRPAAYRRLGRAAPATRTSTPPTAAATT